MKPLLAATVPSLSDLRYPLLATPKFDGIRCLLWEGRAVTRKLKPIPNTFIRESLEATYRENFDGELVIPGADFNQTQSAVMSACGTPEFQYVIFDVIDPGLPYSERHTHPACLKPVVISCAEELLDYERECLAQGHEGVMLRSPDGRYKFGRSTLKEGILLKWKRFLDAEAEVVGFEEKMHNANDLQRDNLGYAKRSSAQAGLLGSGVLGALVVVDQTKQRFSIGTGFDDETRRAIWEARGDYLGKKVNFTYQQLSRYGIPRFPVFRGFRPEIE